MKKYRYADQTINAKLHLAELMLDSVTQSMVKKPGQEKKWLRQLRRALGAIRSCQAIFPQKDYTLTRCRNIDELPSMIKRSPARTDWHKFKRRQKAEKEQQILEVGAL